MKMNAVLRRRSIRKYTERDTDSRNGGTQL